MKVNCKMVEYSVNDIRVRRYEYPAFQNPKMIVWYFLNDPATPFDNATESMMGQKEHYKYEELHKKYIREQKLNNILK